MIKTTTLDGMDCTNLIFLFNENLYNNEELVTDLIKLYGYPTYIPTISAFIRTSLPHLAIEPLEN